MKQLVQGIISLAILTGLTACSPIKGSIRTVKVEQASPDEIGVVLDSVPATPYTNPIDDTLFVSKDLAVATAMDTVSADAVAVKSDSLVAVKDVTASRYAAVALEPTAVQLEPAPIKVGTQYFYVSNKDINNALKEKLASSYAQLAELYQSTISNNKSLSLVPQLNVYYQFKAKIGPDQFTDSISFPLSDAFNYSGALLRVTGTKVQVFWGVGKLEKNLTSAKLAAGVSPVVANLFAPSDKLEFFRVSDLNVFGYDRVSGGNMFSIGLNGEKFQLSGLNTLPVAADTQRVESRRVNSIVAAKLALKLNSRLFFYGDSKSYVSHIYYFGPDFLFKELKGQCAALNELGYVPAGLQCPGVVLAQPVLMEATMLKQ